MSTITELKQLLDDLPAEQASELHFTIKCLLRDAFTSGFSEARGREISPYDGGHEQAGDYMEQLYREIAK